MVQNKNKKQLRK